MRRLVSGVVIGVVVFSLVFSVFLLLSSLHVLDDGLLPTAKASDSFVFLCINEPPVINVSGCPEVFNQSTSLVDNSVWCWANASDVDADALSYSLSPSPLPNGLFASLSANGGNLTMDASQDALGAQNITITVADSSGCLNGNDSYVWNFTVLDINDPPEFVLQIPDVSFASGTYLSAFSLYTFFEDVDGDALTFSVSGANIVQVTINQASGDVMLYSEGCGTEYLVFRARDPGNLSASSNIVEVEVSCSTQAPQTPSSGTGGSSGGGGGGGSITPPCYPKWKCDEWSNCFINGTRFRRCIDLNACKVNDRVRVFWENCTYIPTCNDGIMNGDETGIDCGGSCPACGTCFDGLLNNDEVEIDCGGPNCEACHNCSDGIMNYEEEGVDCGGPFCGPCPTCDDGIMNGDETGIDCGGSCPACSIRETPGIVADDSILRDLLLWLAALAIIGVLAFKFYRKQILSLLARLGWYLTRRHHKVVLLDDNQKSELLAGLVALEKNLLSGKLPPTKVIDRFTELGRFYLSEVLGLSFEMTHEEVALKSKELVKNDSLRRVMFSFFSLLQRLERVDTFSVLECRVYIEELRQIVFQTAEITSEDLLQDATELEVQGSAIDSLRLTMYNLFLTVQFEELSTAKKHYLSLIRLFESLPESQKGLVFDDIGRAYQEVRYLLSWSGN